MPAEDQDPPQRGAEHEAHALGLEVPVLEVFVERLEVLWEIARPRLVQSLLVDVGGVDLDPTQKLLSAQRLAEHHGHGVGLLTRCRAGAPDADLALLGDDARHDALSHVVPSVRVPEELGDVDQDLVEQHRKLVRMHLQVVEVGGEVVDAELLAALGDSPHEARALVAGEVDSARLAQVLDQVLELVTWFEAQSRTLPATRVTSAEGISFSESTKSTAPVRIAAEGMLKNSEVASSWTMTVPPRALIAVTPIEPSLPAPVRTTAMARSPYAAATDSNRRSADGRTKFTSSV